MRKLLLVFLLLQIGLFAQLSNTNIWMMRGDTKTLSFNYNGNILNDSLIFVVKSSKEITAVRLISKTTYDNQINILFGVSSFVYVRLDAGDTDDLTLAKYYYDITRIHNGDSTTIFIGELNLQPDIGTPFDGTDVTGRVTTVSLNNGTTLNSVVVWDTTSQYWEPMSFSSFESLLNISPGSLPDSVLFSSDSTDQRTFSDAKYQTKAFLNVKDYGAVGDTLTDDVTAIQSAIDYLEDKGGGTLFFPDGEYMISNPLSITSNNISIIGTGNTTIRYTDDALTDGEPTPMIVVGLNWDLQTGDETRVQGFSIQDVTFDFNSDNNNTTVLNLGSCIFIGFTDYVYLRNITIINALSAALEIQQCRYVDITSCNIYEFRERTLGAGAAGIAVANFPFSNDSLYNYGGYVNITNNIIHDGDFCAIQVSTKANAIISANNITDVPYGIDLEIGIAPLKQVVITNNVVNRFSGGGINVGNTSGNAGLLVPNSEKILISNNVLAGDSSFNSYGITFGDYEAIVSNNIISGVAYGMNLGDSYDTPLTGKINISNNLIQLYNGANGCGIGFYKEKGATDTSTTRNIKINDNIIDGNYNLREGISIAGRVNNVTISNNSIYNSGYAGINILKGTYSYPSNITIADNEIYNNNQQLSLIEIYNSGVGVDYGIDSVFITGNKIYDNQVSKTQGYGIVLRDSNEVVVLKDNILLGNHTSPIFMGSNVVAAKINNIIRENNGETIFSSNIQKPSTYQITNPTLADSIFLGYFDTDITIDSIWFSTDDSVSIQVKYGDNNELIFGDDIPIIGDELAPDSGFNVVTTYWNLYGCTYSGGEIHFNSDSLEYLYNCFNIDINKRYIVEYIVSDYTSGQVYSSLGTNEGIHRASTGTFIDTLLCTGNPCINIIGYPFVGSIDSVSVKEISASQIIIGDSYFSSFNSNVIPAGDKAYLYFTNIDTNVTNFKFKIYWRGDDASVVNNVNGLGSIYESAYTGEEIDKAIGNTLYSVIKTNPDSATTFTLLRTKAETIIDSVFALVQGASALVDFNLAYGTNRTSGTNVFGSSQSADNVTVGEIFTTFSSATIPVNNMIWLNITNTDNTPEEFLCVIYYH